MKKQNAIGVIGGFGPEATTDFYLKLINKSLKNSDCYPEIFIYNTPITFNLESLSVSNEENKFETALKRYLIDGITSLENIKEIKYYVIPCNSLHAFLNDLKKVTSKPFINIIEESVNFIKKHSFKKVGILSTKITVQSELYQDAFKKNNIEVEIPSKTQQDKITKVIMNILDNKKTIKDKKILLSVIADYKKRQCDCVLLACTDLEILLKNELSKKKYLFDTLDILAEATDYYIHND